MKSIAVMGAIVYIAGFMFMMHDPFSPHLLDVFCIAIFARSCPIGYR